MKKTILSLIFIAAAAIGFTQGQYTFPYNTSTDTTWKPMTYKDTTFIKVGDSVFIDLNSINAMVGNTMLFLIREDQVTGGVTSYIDTIVVYQASSIFNFKIDSVYKYIYAIRTINGTLLSYFWIRGIDSTSVVDTIPTDTIPTDTVPNDTIQTGMNLYPTDDSGAVLGIYPNPATDNITITFGESRASENAEVEIYDVTGRTKVQGCCFLWSGGDKTNVDVSRLRPGWYFVKVGSQNSRFMKQ